MTKRYVITTDPLTKEQEKQFSESLGKQTGWWHWMPNMWLVTDWNDALSEDRIMEMLQRVNKMARAVILRVEPVTWAALALDNQYDRDMVDWIKRFWVEEIVPNESPDEDMF
jgi:hypothetical protein